MSGTSTIYSEWFRKLGCRLVDSLKDPRHHHISSFALPYDSVAHVGLVEIGARDEEGEEIVVGPNLSDPVFSGYAKLNKIVHVTDTYLHPDVVGKPIKTDNDIKDVIRKYVGQDAMLYWDVNAVDKVRGNRTLYYVSYAPLADVYRYGTINVLTGWHQWYNEYQTALINIKQILTTYPNKNQFLILPSPSTVPSLSVLDTILTSVQKGKSDEKVYDHLTQSQLKLFGHDSIRYFMDIWMMFASKNHSIIGKALNAQQLSKVNIVYLLNGKWVCINLGVFFELIKENNPKQGTVSLSDFKRKFLYFNLQLISLNAAIEVKPEGDQGTTLEERLNEIESPTNVLNIDETALSENIEVTISQQQKTSKKPKSSAEVMQELKEKMKKIDNGEKEEGETGPTDDDVVDNEVINRDLEQLEIQHAQQTVNELEIGYSPYRPIGDALEDAVFRDVDRLFKSGVISPKEAARVKSAAQSYKKNKDPYGRFDTVKQAMVIVPETLKVPDKNPVAKDIKGVRDKSFLSSSITFMDRRYVKDVLKADVVNATMHLQKAGYAVIDYKIEPVTTITDRYEIHRAQIMTPRGVTKTLSFQIPTPDSEGNMLVGGVKLRMRAQKGDMPVRKVSPSRVALSSYSSKLFLDRTDRVAFNSSKWLVGSVFDQTMEEGQTLFTSVKYGKVFDRDFKCPRNYSSMAMRFESFEFAGYRFNFNCKKTADYFSADELNLGVTHDSIPFAVGKGHTLHFNSVGQVIRYEKGVAVFVSSFEELMGLDPQKCPVDYVEYGLLGDSVPLGFLLAYHIGLGNLLATLKATYRRVPRGSQMKLATHEYAVRFNDESLILDRREKVTSLLIGGFNRYKASLGEYSIYQFDDQDVYGTILAKYGVMPRKLVDIDTAMDIWIDPITKSILEDYKLPTDLFNLLIYATSLLVNDQHKDKNDRLDERDKGLERISGAISRSLYETVRRHKASPASARTGLDHNPKDIWFSIVTDSAVMGIEESNPIHNLKDQEELIMGGTGGRSTKTMMSSDRKFHKSAEGNICEATVDSAEVAAKVFRSADPCYTSLRGTIKPVGNVKEKTSRCFSPSALLVPGAYYDDPKRINFINIQNSSSTTAVGYHPSPYRTGYERVVAHRAGKFWASMAEQDGKVISKKGSIIKVQYNDGTVKAYKFGDTPGKWSGKWMSHRLVTDLNVGDEFKASTPIVYNADYFKRDTLYSDQIIMANTCIAMVSFLEADSTYEDSCLIDQELSDKLGTKFSKVKHVNVPFDYDVQNLLKVGDEVDTDTILCTMIPPLSSVENSRHVGQSKEILDKLSKESPKAKKKGKITYIRVVYSGEIEDMSPALQALVEEQNAKIFKECRETGDTPHDAYVSPTTRVGGIEIGRDTVSIEFHITYDLPMSGSDKLVFGGQMKSVAAGLATGRMETKSGMKVNALFSALSNEKRGVRSIYYMGTTNRLLYHATEMMVQSYLSGQRK